MKYRLNKQKEPRVPKNLGGFTIIEVVIVLAIAGLIMAIVFIAVPQLNRNARDNARQNVANRLHSELGTYAANNSGTYPFTTSALADFSSRYASTIKMTNPSTGSTYSLDFASSDGANPSADQILIHRGARCTGEQASGTSSSATTRSYALRVALDRSNIFYCIDNG
ncbi:MAG: type II secretion system protein [Candidatus Saccharimonadales bacterium]